jgi:hypothetical protein
MKCRGFKNRFPVLDSFHFHARDVIFSVLFAGFLSLLGILQWTKILL